MSDWSGSALQPVGWRRVRLTGGFLAERQRVNRTASLQAVYDHLKSTGRIDAFRLDWRPGQPNEPHVFWDSDVAKWLEGACYALATDPAPTLRAQVEETVALICAAQQPDGYLNVHYTVVEPDRRWSNLRDRHELYCAGHLMEAAVAHHEATGERRLLDTMSRYADYIGTVFGREPGQRRGYPGHEEIELALVRLWRATGERRYLELSRYFVDERGRQPHYYDQEARERGEEPGARPYDYLQAHVPVREQESAEGHAVRAMYLFSGAVEVAAATGDGELLAACRRLWDNVVERRMYLTGGVGSTAQGERFTTDYDLPNETAYTETCAAIGLVFWAARMLAVEADGRYADVLERALYNGVLGGLSLDGRGFFYDNPLAVEPARYSGRFQPRRQEWFGTACCPTNMVRLLGSLGGYVYGQSDEALYVHLYTAGVLGVETPFGGVELAQETDYPWDGAVRLRVTATPATPWTLALRLPGWCRSPRLRVNGDEAVAPVQRGYARLHRTWRAGDEVSLHLPMAVERCHCRLEVAANRGRVALQRGPLVYCLEEVDNGPALDALALPAGGWATDWEPELLGGCVVIRGPAQRAVSWSDGLYRTDPPAAEEVSFQAVPFALRMNRGDGEMRVWLRSAG